MSQTHPPSPSDPHKIPHMGVWLEGLGGAPQCADSAGGTSARGSASVPLLLLVVWFLVFFVGHQSAEEEPGFDWH